jgi:hypothetical protein
MSDHREAPEERKIEVVVREEDEQDFEKGEKYEVVLKEKAAEAKAEHESNAHEKEVEADEAASKAAAHEANKEAAHAEKKAAEHEAAMATSETEKASAEHEAHVKEKEEHEEAKAQAKEEEKVEHAEKEKEVEEKRAVTAEEKEAEHAEKAAVEEEAHHEHEEAVAKKSSPVAVAVALPPAPISDEHDMQISTAAPAVPVQKIERTFTTPSGQPVTVLEVKPAETIISEPPSAPAPVVEKHITYVEPLPRAPSPTKTLPLEEKPKVLIVEEKETPMPSIVEHSEPVAVVAVVEPEPTPVIHKKDHLIVERHPEGTVETTETVTTTTVTTTKIVKDEREREEIVTPPAPVAAVGVDPPRPITTVQRAPPTTVIAEPPKEERKVIVQTVPEVVPPPPIPSTTTSTDFAPMPMETPHAAFRGLDVLGTPIGLFPEYFALHETRFAIVERLPSASGADWMVRDEDGRAMFSIDTTIMSASARRHLHDMHGLTVLDLRQRRCCLCHPR